MKVLKHGVFKGLLLILCSEGFSWHPVTHTLIAKEAANTGDEVLIMASVGPDGLASPWKVLGQDVIADVIHAPVPKNGWTDKPCFAYYLMMKRTKRNPEFVQVSQLRFVWDREVILLIRGSKLLLEFEQTG